MKFGLTFYVIKHFLRVYPISRTKTLSFIILLLSLDNLGFRKLSLHLIARSNSSTMQHLTSDLEFFLIENEEKRNLYSPFDFENSFFPTPLNYLVARILQVQRQRLLVCKEILVADHPNVSLQKKAASTKTKGIHI